jgi:isopenicillin N synthase-like dioxygenase
MSTVKPEIPTIDIQPWLTGSNPDIVVEQVKAACKTYGFFQLVGHGVPLELQEEILECAKRFFSLPLEAKERLAKDPLTGRGYEVIGSQALNVGEAPDEKEVFQD